MKKAKSKCKTKGRKMSAGNESNENMEAFTVSPSTLLAQAVVGNGEDIDHFSDMVEGLCSEEMGNLNINERDAAGLTALNFAVGEGSVEKVKILLEQGADPNNVDNMCKMTPLFHATGRYPNPEIATLLVKHGAHVGYKSRGGATALHGACLQGNKDCIKVLIKHGADPRAISDDGTTPLDLAKDDETREILHKKIRREDEKEDKIDEACKVCDKTEDEPGIKLKRCSACHAVWYCSKECQKKDWKELGHKTTCEGYVMGYEGDIPGFSSMFSHVFGAKQPMIKMHEVSPGHQKKEAANALKNNRFVVKIQIPMGCTGGSSSLMVYNEDKSVHFMIDSDNPGYFTLMKKIKEEGYLGLKGYFWAERTQKSDGGVKIFHGRTAPFQRW